MQANKQFDATTARNSLFCTLLVLLAFYVVLVATPAMADDAKDNSTLCHKIGLVDDLVGKGKAFTEDEFENVLKMKWKQAEPKLEEGFAKVKKKDFWEKNKEMLQKNWKPKS